MVQMHGVGTTEHHKLSFEDNNEIKSLHNKLRLTLHECINLFNCRQHVHDAVTKRNSF